MISILSLFFSSPALFSNTLETIPRSPTIIHITIFHNLFSSLARSRYFSILSFKKKIILWFVGMAKFSWQQTLFLLSINSRNTLQEVYLNINVPKNFMFHFLRQILVYWYMICQHCQILVSCTIPRRSYFLPSYTGSYILLILVYCILLLSD